MLRRTSQTGLVIYRDEVRDILRAISLMGSDVQRIREILEEDDGEQQAPENDA